MPMERGIGDEGLQRVAEKVAPKTSQEQPETEQDKRQKYWETVKSYAEEIKDEVKEYGGEVSDLAHQYVDGSYYIIYYHANMEVLQNTENEDAISDVGMEIDTSQGWRSILTQVAYWAMLEDVYDELRNLGWDGMDSFEDEEEDEDDFDEEEF